MRRGRTGGEAKADLRSFLAGRGSDYMISIELV
jgi:hypothetical protein